MNGYSLLPSARSSPDAAAFTAAIGTWSPSLAASAVAAKVRNGCRFDRLVAPCGCQQDADTGYAQV